MDDFQKEMFGMSDIDKIQEDIARDLSGYINDKPPENETFADLFLVPQENLQEPAEAAQPPEPIDTGFYRETIKSATPAPRKSWARTAAILIFICTIGTGMLGFGMGSGWAFVRRYAENGAENADASANTPEGLTFTGTTYIIEPSTPEVATISDVVELLAPAVVGITTHRGDISNNNDIFPRGNEMPPFAFRSTSYGSGIIFSSADDRIFIATSLYVVRGGTRWDVSISGSEPIAARPVGHSFDNDLAVLYICKESLVNAGIDSIAFATFGDSDDMRLGDVVLAIGNAMGEGTSVTRGIISAAERQVYLPDRRYPISVMQTDAAINYGNSGGPLINTRGEIVGININRATDLITGSSLVEGMSYSIPASVAAPILEAIAADYRRPAIGITGTSLSVINDRYGTADHWGIPALGVFVSTVPEGRAAYNAGIQPEDVITGFDGQPIFDMEQLQAALRTREIGDIVEIRLLRGGTLAITVELELGMLIRDNFDIN